MQRSSVDKVLGPNHFYVATTLDSIANLKDRAGQIEEATYLQAFMYSCMCYFVALEKVCVWGFEVLICCLAISQQNTNDHK